ncbi:hypothetical protein CHS0354_002165, partial [Potamilus streckersoni]
QWATSTKGRLLHQLQSEATKGKPPREQRINYRLRTEKTLIKTSRGQDNLAFCHMCQVEDTIHHIFNE